MLRVSAYLGRPQPLPNLFGAELEAVEAGLPALLGSFLLVDFADNVPIFRRV